MREVICSEFPEPETKVEEGIEEINSSINNSINEAISSNPIEQAVDNAATNNGSAVTDPSSTIELCLALILLLPQ